VKILNFTDRRVAIPALIVGFEVDANFANDDGFFVFVVDGDDGFVVVAVEGDDIT
jgi:hypothetical protein